MGVTGNESKNAQINCANHYLSNVFTTHEKRRDLDQVFLHHVEKCILKNTTDMLPVTQNISISM